jgi:mannose-6-phosphate isomerase-like protein (cupin superfamily)
MQDRRELMASPLIIRKGEGKKIIMIGSDPWSFRITGAEIDGRLDFIEATITHLQGPPLHLHHEQDDTFFVIEGILTVQVGDQLFDLHAGDLVCTPKGVSHTFANVGKEPVRVINIMTPGGFDRVMEDYASLPAGRPDPQVVEELAQKHTLAFVGPSTPMRLGLV